jgi:hypothetical protein
MTWSTQHSAQHAPHLRSLCLASRIVHVLLEAVNSLRSWNLPHCWHHRQSSPCSLMIASRECSKQMRYLHQACTTEHRFYAREQPVTLGVQPGPRGAERSNPVVVVHEGDWNTTHARVDRASHRRKYSLSWLTSAPQPGTWQIIARDEVFCSPAERGSAAPGPG